MGLQHDVEVFAVPQPRHPIPAPSEHTVSPVSLYGKRGALYKYCRRVVQLTVGGTKTVPSSTVPYVSCSSSYSLPICRVSENWACSSGNALLSLLKAHTASSGKPVLLPRRCSPNAERPLRTFGLISGCPVGSSRAVRLGQQAGRDLSHGWAHLTPLGSRKHRKKS